MTKEFVVLVDEDNNELGLMEKLEAHEKGVLHRAFSIFLFNEKGETLIQRRDVGKYHCGGLWSNTVCSHQRDKEDTISASVRRLREEMGIDYQAQKMECIGSEIYMAQFENGLIENEYDHVVIGNYDGEIVMNPEEVMDYKWISVEDLRKDMEINPDFYTPWFKIIMNKQWFLKSIVS